MAETARRLREAMQEAVSTTFENMAFMEARPLDEPHDCLAHTNPLCVSLLVHQPVQSELRLVMPEELLIELACGIYACAPDEISARQQDDILAELLNTIAGLFLTRVTPARLMFEMGLPETDRSCASALEQPALQWHFRIDEHYFCLSANGGAWHELNPAGQ